MFSDRQARRSRALSVWIAAVCVVLVLVATTAEAAHIHEFELGGPPQQVQAGAAVNPSHGFCLLCVSAHSPGLAAHVAPLAPKVILAPAAMETQPSHRQLLQSFALQVRPPPAV